MDHLLAVETPSFDNALKLQLNTALGDNTAPVVHPQQQPAKASNNIDPLHVMMALMAQQQQQHQQLMALLIQQQCPTAQKTPAQLFEERARSRRDREDGSRRLMEKVRANLERERAGNRFKTPPHLEQLQNKRRGAVQEPRATPQSQREQQVIDLSGVDDG